MNDMDAGMDGSDADVAMTNSNIEAASESGSTTLESMGYVDSASDTRGMDGHFTGSKKSLLKTAIIVTVVSVFVLTLLYYFVGGILTGFGII